MNRDSPCKVLFLVPSLRGGGAERAMVTLLNHLDETRIQAVLGVVNLRGAVYRSELRPDLEVIDLDCGRVRNAIPRIVALVRQRRPRVVLSTLGHLNLALAMVRALLPADARLIGRESTLPSRGIRKLRAPLLWASAYRRFYPRLDQVICQSQAMKDDLVTGFGLPAGRAVVIHNPLDIARIQAAARSGPLPDFGQRGLDNGLIELVAVGRLSPEKGFDLLIDAVALGGDPRIHVSILGEGPEEQALRQRAADRGIAGQVHFRGFQRNPYRYMAAAAALVLSSRYEGFPNVVLEALACGTPVIASPAPGGTREILDGIGECEIAGEVSAPALAAAIGRFLERRPGRVPPAAVAPFAAAAIARQYEKTILDVAAS